VFVASGGVIKERRPQGKFDLAELPVVLAEGTRLNGESSLPKRPQCNFWKYMTPAGFRIPAHHTPTAASATAAQEACPEPVLVAPSLKDAHGLVELVVGGAAPDHLLGPWWRGQQRAGLEVRGCCMGCWQSSDDRSYLLKSFVVRTSQLAVRWG